MTHDLRSGPIAGLEVLVVEDEYLLADDIARALSRAGATVVGPFRDMAGGFAAVETHAGIGAAVLDVNLNGTMVFPFVDVLRERGIPIVFTTGYDEGVIPAAYRDIPHCEKPVNTREVVRLLTGRASAIRHASPGGSRS